MKTGNLIFFLIFTIVSFNIFCQDLWEMPKAKIGITIPNTNRGDSLNLKKSKRSIYVNAYNRPIGFIGKDILVIANDMPRLSDHLFTLGLSFEKYELRNDEYIIDVQYKSEDQIISLVKLLRKSDFIQYAEPNYYLYNEWMNDPLFADQWNLDNIEGSYITVAHSVTKGCPSVLTAIADIGVELNHPDLSPNLHSLTYNTQTNITSVNAGSVNPVCASSNCAHGTAVASIIAAEDNNQSGLVGVVPNSKITSINFFYDFQQISPTTLDYQRIFDWSRLNGVDIINCSWGVPNPENYNIQSYWISRGLVL